MTDRERLVRWMADNGYNDRTLADALGDVRQGVWYMTSGKRDVSAGFILRFRRVFGNAVTDSIFVDFAPVADSELAAPAAPQTT